MPFYISRRPLIVILVIVGLIIGGSLWLLNSRHSTASAATIDVRPPVPDQYVTTVVRELQPGETGWTCDTGVIRLDHQRRPYIEKAQNVTLGYWPGDTIAISVDRQGKYHTVCYQPVVTWALGGAVELDGDAPTTLTFADPKALPPAKK